MCISAPLSHLSLGWHPRVRMGEVIYAKCNSTATIVVRVLLFDDAHVSKKKPREDAECRLGKADE